MAPTLKIYGRDYLSPVFASRAPASTDIEYQLSQIWVNQNTTPYTFYMLVYLDMTTDPHEATWNQFSFEELPAGSVVFTPYGEDTANNVQDAIEQLVDMRFMRRGYNDTGSTLATGTVICVAGYDATNGIEKIKAVSSGSEEPIGFVVSNIATGASGYYSQIAIYQSTLDTTGYAVGTTVYTTTSGALSLTGRCAVGYTLTVGANAKILITIGSCESASVIVPEKTCYVSSEFESDDENLRTFTTWASADAYIVGLSTTNQWYIKIIGENNENIVARNHIAIIGDPETTILTGGIGSEQTYDVSPYQWSYSNCKINNMNFTGTGYAMLSANNCDLNIGAGVCSGSIFVANKCRIMTGSYENATMMLWNTNILGGTLTPTAECAWSQSQNIVVPGLSVELDGKHVLYESSLLLSEGQIGTDLELIAYNSNIELSNNTDYTLAHNWTLKKGDLKRKQRLLLAERSGFSTQEEGKVI